MYIKSHYDYVKMQSSVIRPNPSIVKQAEISEI